MKSGLIYIAFFLGFTVYVYGQPASEFYNKGKFESDMAIEMLQKMQVYNVAEGKKIIEKFKSAAGNYLNAEKDMPGIKYPAYYNASVNLFLAATVYEEGADHNNAYETLKSGVELWPDLESIPEKYVATENKITRSGYIYIFPVAATAEARKRNYYNMKYLMARVCASIKKKDEMLLNYKDVADHAADMPEIAWLSSYYVASHARKEGQLCENEIYAVHCLEYASEIQPKDNEISIADQNAMIDEMEQYLIAADSAGCDHKGMIDKAVAAIAGMSGKWNLKPKYAYTLGEKVYNSGDHSFDLLYNEYKLARTLYDPEVSERWRLRLVENGRYFSSVQWKLLSDYYYTLSDNDARADALANAKKKERKEHIGYFVAVEPTCILLGQYAISGGFIGINASHELRFGFIPDGIKPSLKSGSDTEKVPLYFITHYNGFQVSYSFKYLTKGENPNTYSYIGSEFRYTSRNYTDSLTYYNNHITPVTEKYKGMIQPHAQVFDACLIFGGIHKGKLIYTDVYGGIGIGYKMISYNIDESMYAVANAPFIGSLWNKLYVPIRVGIKIGLVL